MNRVHCCHSLLPSLMPQPTNTHLVAAGAAAGCKPLFDHDYKFAHSCWRFQHWRQLNPGSTLVQARPLCKRNRGTLNQLV
jgi:hypothetical protein